MVDPESGQIFEEYEPDKYDCIAVDDEYVQAVAEKLAGVRVYWHGLDRQESVQALVFFDVFEGGLFFNYPK